MFMRIFVASIIVIASLVGMFALILPREQLITLSMFRDFFDVALPILGFGALVKYLATSCLHCKVCHQKICLENAHDHSVKSAVNPRVFNGTPQTSPARSD